MGTTRAGAGPPETFCQKDLLKTFSKSTGKNLCQSLFFKKAINSNPSTLCKKRNPGTIVFL